MLGVITEKSAIRVYHASTLTTIDTAQKIRALSDTQADPGTFIEIPVSLHSKIVHRAVKNLALPSVALVVSVKRDGHLVVPHGNTIIQPGDQVTVFVSPSDQADKVRRELSETAKI
ncbi:MAG: hypothetical protein C7B46_03410 [Sulfobacillus benefaciens]|uniref:RCK C-terminal domain-containing protein n=1 Tax=Sulfobacillus benefaciens TaxID=453960 RepID=A0A2T2XKF8_9FIRM|nr:MAG: hypothetical protein C7B46_03410 [Sulfobacillus benefaciens]